MRYRKSRNKSRKKTLSGKITRKTRQRRTHKTPNSGKRRRTNRRITNRRRTNRRRISKIKQSGGMNGESSVSSGEEDDEEDDEVKDLRGKLYMASEYGKTLVEANEELKALNLELGNNKEILDQQIEEHRHRVQELESEVATYSDLDTDKEKRIAEIEGELETLKEELVQERDKETGGQDDVELTSLRSELDRKISENESLKERLKVTQRQLQEHETMVAEYILKDEKQGAELTSVRKEAKMYQETATKLSDGEKKREGSAAAAAAVAAGELLEAQTENKGLIEQLREAGARVKGSGLAPGAPGSVDTLVVGTFPINYVKYQGSLATGEADEQTAGTITIDISLGPRTGIQITPDGGGGGGGGDEPLLSFYYLKSLTIKRGENRIDLEYEPKSPESPESSKNVSYSMKFTKGVDLDNVIDLLRGAFSIGHSMVNRMGDEYSMGYHKLKDGVLPNNLGVDVAVAIE
jgi:hypothetical protein